MLYRIAKWDSVFERAESRKLKHLTWVAMPTGFCSSGYQLMLDEFGDRAPAIYGAWCALVSVASSCSVRGVLGNSKGQPLQVSHISRITGFPSSVFEDLIVWAKRDEISWLEVLSESEISKIYRENSISGESPDVPGDRRGIPPTTQPNPTQPNQTSPNPTQPGSIDGRTDEEFLSFGIDEANSIVKSANKLIKAFPNLEPDFAWRAAWVGFAISVGFVDDIIRIKKEKSIRQPRKYIEAAIRNDLIKRGRSIDSCLAKVPAPPKVKEAVSA